MAVTRSYVETVLSRFAAFGPATAFSRDGEHVSFTAARDTVLRLAAMLVARGVRSGDGVAVLSGNRAAATLAQFALHFVGARAIWLPPGIAATEQADFLRLAGARMLLHDNGWFADRAVTLAAHADVRAYPMDEPLTEPPLPAGAAAPADAVCTLFYTGGTTGSPKLVTHGPELFATVTRMAVLAPPADGRRTFLATLPIGHASGQLGLLLALLRGGRVLLHDGFDAGAVWRAIARDGVTGAFLVPALLYELLDHPLAGSVDVGGLRTVTYGGAPVAPARLRAAIELLGPVLQQVYGSVEAGPITTLGPAEHDLSRPELLRSCGRPIRVADVRIDGEERTGEICVRGPMVTSGYWGRPDLTAAQLTDGWLRTGDIGHRDEHGRLYIVDRRKDVIVTGRHATTVPSRVVEDVLADHPSVARAAVIGVPDPRWGERIQAVVVPRAGCDCDGLADSLRGLVAARLGELYQPAGVDVVDRLPLTALAKVDKPALRARYAT